MVGGRWGLGVVLGSSLCGSSLLVELLVLESTGVVLALALVPVFLGEHSHPLELGLGGSEF